MDPTCVQIGLLAMTSEALLFLDLSYPEILHDRKHGELNIRAYVDRALQVKERNVMSVWTSMNVANRISVEIIQYVKIQSEAILVNVNQDTQRPPKPISHTMELDIKTASILTNARH